MFVTKEILANNIAKKLTLIDTADSNAADLRNIIVVWIAGFGRSFTGAL